MNRPESCGFLSDVLGEQDGSQAFRVEQDVTVLLSQCRIPTSEGMDQYLQQSHNRCNDAELAVVYRLKERANRLQVGWVFLDEVDQRRSIQTHHFSLQRGYPFQEARSRSMYS